MLCLEDFGPAGLAKDEGVGIGHDYSVIASEAKQSSAASNARWIASSLRSSQ
jgi:hypothetical protein